MEIKYTYESLEKMHLTDLRQIAREIGVKNPTSRTKLILIADIMDIEEGRAKPYFNTGRGRPPIPRYTPTNDKVSYENYVKKQVSNELNKKIQKVANNLVVELVNYINEYIDNKLQHFTK